MREIKFKAFNGKNFYEPIYSNGYWFDDGRSFEDGNHTLDPVMQFTGLHDKNGKEIYEGDIVKCISLANDHHQRGSINVLNIKFFMGSFVFSHGDQEAGAQMFPLKVNLDVEVIGNIYENPELLK